MVFGTVRLHASGLAVTPPVSCREIICFLVILRECRAQPHIMGWYYGAKRTVVQI